MAHEAGHYGEAVGSPQLMGYLGKATQWGRELWGPGESNGGFPVNIQDQHSRAYDLKFIQALTAPPFPTLAVAANPDDRTITVTDATGFVDGITVLLTSGAGLFYEGEQVGVAVGNVVTLDTPIDVKFPIGSNVVPATRHMNVDGSTTTQIFQIGPVGVATGLSVDITRIMGYLQGDSAMDDALFGNLAALTYGIVLRVNNSVITNIWNVKSNGDIGLLCFDKEDTTKAPAGSFGLRFRNTYAGQSKHGVTLRLDPGDTLEILIQDDLTDLEDFQIMAQGHVVTD